MSAPNPAPGGNDADELLAEELDDLEHTAPISSPTTIKK